jgi:pyruvate formate-lyase/glycerol dehydratase family glycyl radical enzyme
MQESAFDFNPESGLRHPSNRFKRIKAQLFSEKVHLCTERAELITSFFKRYNDPSDPVIVQKAKAFRFLLHHKSVRIFKDELIAGNVGSYRKSAIIQPELSGVFGCQDLLWMDKRTTNPFKVSWKKRLRLMTRVLPYWLFRNMVFRAFYPFLGRFFGYAAEQLNARYYLINEAGGIGHFIPDYPKMLKLGVQGYLNTIQNRQTPFYTAVRITCEGLMDYADRLANKADRMAINCTDPDRATALREIARVCKKVPRKPADTFHEALQSLWLTHMAVCLEGINSAISFGRMDQYLYPYFQKDMRSGRITSQRAKELLLCFSAKTTEHVFLLTQALSLYHGGYLVVQAAIVGGVDTHGNDAVNDLTYLFLDVMEESGLRDPNYQVRIHKGAPDAYLQRAAEVARKGKGVPAFFCDEAVVGSLTAHGYPVKIARDYGIVGCVEQAIPGQSFLSTDAALFNLPVCLELALNQGRRFKGTRCVGAATPDPKTFVGMDQIMAAFRDQVNHMVLRMIKDLAVIENGNRVFHPTPFSSMLVAGCLSSGKDVTGGGARYNGSGIQGVGVADVADSLAAIQDVVFQRKRLSLVDVLDAVKKNFEGSALVQAELARAPKFGNNRSAPDTFAAQTVRIFHDALVCHNNTRKGPYVPGFYSSTSHVAFGAKTGALPSGRKAGQAFAASLGAVNGCDRQGPTALLNSVCSVDASLAPNGYALNLRFDPNTVAGDRGTHLLTSLVAGFFESGGMELQFNILDPEQLQDARRHPGRYPDLVVRVAGYCAYFDDLPDQVKMEIISRTRICNHL